MNSKTARAKLPIVGDRYELRTDQSAELAESDAEALAVKGGVGFIHSYETGSVVDGPGVRVVIWTTGCFFRCQYCHNPDTWHITNGRKVTVERVTQELKKYVRFLTITKGGVTISGGEPLVQAPFVLNIFRESKQLGIHTALDTNGYLGDRLSDADLELIDLVLLDIKSWDPETHLRAVGKDVEPVLRFAQRLSKVGKPAWIRFVLVPGLTDDFANVEGLAGFVATLRNVERVEVLPFHQLGKFKWEKLGIAYPLANTQPPSADLVSRVQEQFRSHGLTVA